MKALKQTGLSGMNEKGDVARIARRGVRANMDLFNNSLRVILEQRYVNAETTPIEAVYSFPLPLKSAVTGFRAIIGQRVLEGTLMEREAAFEVYDTAIAENQTAYLLDQDEPNHFTISVGNLAPGEDVTVALTYVQMIDYVEGNFRLILPTLISLVYTPDDVLAAMDPAALDRLYPPRSLENLPYGLELHAKVLVPGGIKALDCPSHKVKTDWAGDMAVVSFSAEKVALDRDFVLNITPRVPAVNLAYCCQDTFDKGWIAYTQFKLESTPGTKTARNIVFMLDCSGSMDGENIEQAKAALLLLLASLQHGDKFNIVAYGSGFKFLSATLLPYSDDSLKRAREWTQERNADMGGTEVLPPLLRILKSGEEYEQSIILLTDGDVGNVTQIVEKVNACASKARIYTIGLGFGPDENLLDSLAAETGGAVEIVHPGERLEPVISRHLNRIKGPRVQDLQLTIGKYQEAIPVWDQSILPNENKFFFRHLDAAPSGAAALRIVFDDGTEQVLLTDLILESPAEYSGIAQLYAKYEVEQLTKLRRGSAQKPAKQQQKLYKLALKYSILSSETSFVLVDPESRVPYKGKVALRRVPVGIQPNLSIVIQNLNCQLSPIKMKDSWVSSKDEDFEPIMDMQRSSGLESKRKAHHTAASPREELRRKIINLQSASGYWDDLGLLDYLLVKPKDWHKLVDLLTRVYKINLHDAEVRALSMLVVTYLREFEFSHAEEFDLILKKAQKWLAQQGSDWQGLLPRLKKLLKGVEEMV